MPRVHNSTGKHGKGMKTLVSFTVLILFLFMNGGYYLYFRISQFNLRREIERKSKENLEKEDLSLIVVPVNEKGKIKWIREGREFSYKDKMYDVIRTEIHKGRKYLYCLNDTREQHLITKFNAVRKKQNKKIWKYRRILSFKYFPAKYVAGNSLRASAVLFSEYYTQYQSLFQDIASPPPKYDLFS